MAKIITFDEFIDFRDVKIRNNTHKQIAKMFYPYFFSVTGNRRLLPDLMGQLLDIDLSDTVTRTSCLNGIFDRRSIPPFKDVDLYIRFQNDVRVFVYGVESPIVDVVLGENEYVLFLLANNFLNKNKRKNGRFIYIVD